MGSDDRTVGDERTALQTPKDIAALFAWADLRGMKYWDFAASRREHRAQLRLHAAQAMHERALSTDASAAERVASVAYAAAAIEREEKELIEAAARRKALHSTEPAIPFDVDASKSEETPQTSTSNSFATSKSLPLRVLRFAVFAIGILCLGFAGALYLTWPQQLAVAMTTLAIALWLNRSSESYLTSLTLIVLSLFCTFRYAYWRISAVVFYFRNPGNNWTVLDAFFIAVLLFAECYAFTVMLLSYMQMIWPLKRKPVPLPDDLAEWPSVDLVIPTYNEPLSVVRFTALAAMNIDWPAEKLHVYILDDGKREEFRAFAEEAGIGYMTRSDNKHAKAGNINRALKNLHSPYLAIFDCDHVPTRSFLQLTMGWFLRDKKLAMLQTPHHFYSPDPFERNLDQFHVVPNEGELFYALIQDGNDFWNSTFFCGSCAVLRRTALDEIGGIAVETVTEDAHTALRMQMRGWNTAYINIPQAAGLSTERLSAHIKQRIRWARGTVQILHMENPLFARGLRFPQRICYFSSVSHFLYALPRLIFLTAPLIYLIFGHINIPGFGLTILVYALPHLTLTNLISSRIQGKHRHSFWNEIYETVLSPYILLPTLLSLISTKMGNFDVTAKGGVVKREFFDKRIARPFLMLLSFDLFGLFCAFARAVQLPYFNLPWWLAFLNWPASIYDGARLGTIFMNVLWTCLSIVSLGVATAVAWESQQRRQTVRMEHTVPTEILLPDGSSVQGITTDLSSGGARTRLNGTAQAKVGDAINFIFPMPDGTTSLPATVVANSGEILRARFDPLNMMQEEALSLVLYARADTWLKSDDRRELDHPLRSLARIFRLSLHGLSQTADSMLREDDHASTTPAQSFASVTPIAPTAPVTPIALVPSIKLSGTKKPVQSIASMLLFALLLGSATRDTSAAQLASTRKSAAPTATTAPANDLGALPLPFYDSSADQHPAVPIVFLSSPSASALRAAGIVASWFGILADNRPLSFSVSIGSIPAGNAIVIAEHAKEIPTAFNLDTLAGATLAVRANPSDKNSKLLLIAGNNADDLLKAATALALNRDGLLQGAQLRINNLQSPTPRLPDDAPRWLRTDKIINLGELAQTNALQSDGSSPVVVTLRLPPDLHFGQTQNLALHLSYRYNGIPLGDASSLQVLVNGAYVSSTPMPHSDQASAALDTIIPVPVSDLRPFVNTIEFHFDFQPARHTALRNLQGAILKDSYLDLGETQHWAELPNLALFANAGYPFTRRADLADTVVILPDSPTTAELEIYLAMMARFGAATGYPVLNVGVTNAAGVRNDGSKDYLLLGTVDDQPALKSLDSALPVGVDEVGLHIHDTESLFNRDQSFWWLTRRSDHVPSGEIETIGGLPDAMIESAQWPTGSQRTVVAVVVRDAAAIPNFLAAFQQSAHSDEIAQSLSVLHGDRFASYRIGNDAYRVGSLALVARTSLFLTEYPWLIVLGAVLLSFLMAALLQAMLRQLAHTRLQDTQ